MGNLEPIEASVSLISLSLMGPDRTVLRIDFKVIMERVNCFGTPAIVLLSRQVQNLVSIRHVAAYVITGLPMRAGTLCKKCDKQMHFIVCVGDSLF